MPAKEFMTLLDVLQQEGTGSIKALDAVRSVGLASPEVTAFPVTVIDGTQYEINMPTGIPRFGFRPANAGAKNLTTEYTNKTVKCYYIDGPIAVDKAVAIHYEHRRPPALRWAEWEERLRHQLVTALQLLEDALGADWLVGERLTHADIMAAVMVSFIRFTEPDEWPSERFPKLEALTRRLEQTPAFLAVPIDKV